MPKDMMQNFELFQPDNLDDAVNLLDKFKGDGWILAGGHDTFSWFKDRAKYSPNLIDLNGINELKGITETNRGVEIGALTSLAEIASSPVTKNNFLSSKKIPATNGNFSNFSKFNLTFHCIFPLLVFFAITS